MSDLVNQILGQVGGQGLAAIANQIGASETQTKSAM